jgi:hypothetical protein
VPRDGEAEARLIEIYKLIGQARTRNALQKAEALVADHPNFALAQLVYGDLLTVQARPVPGLRRRARTTPCRPAARPWWTCARSRSCACAPCASGRPRAPSRRSSCSCRPRTERDRDRHLARPPVPVRERPEGLKLIADYYISVGKSGIEKTAEGDLRTPVGVYFITSNLDPKSLKDFYGAGALPINYPEPLRRPARQDRPRHLAARHAAGAVLARAQGHRRLRGAGQPRPRTHHQDRRGAHHAGGDRHSLRWVPPGSVQVENRRFNDVLQAWRGAKASGDINRLMAFYTPDFSVNGKSMADWAPVMQVELGKMRGRASR